MEDQQSEGFSTSTSAKSIAHLLGAEVVEENELYKYKVFLTEEEYFEVFVEKSRMDRISKASKEDYNKDGTSMYSNNYFEVPVRSHSPYSTFRGRRKVESYDNTNNISYELGNLSNEYFLFLVRAASEENLYESFRRYFRPIGNTVESYLNNAPGDPSRRDIFEFINRVSFGLSTLKITSEKQRSLNKFNDFADSYMFELSYNINSTLVVKRNVDEFLRPSSSVRYRRSSADEIDSPKRFYNDDLIHHYQMGVSSYNPAQKFLSFYHVTEHFFGSIFKEDLVQDIENTLTDPGFSYRRTADIEKIIDKVSDRLIARQEDITYSEREALKLTLRKHLDINYLIDEISNYGDDLIGYYKKNKVPFADAPRVNLENDDKEQEISALSSRIYDTRNSIVHSKSGHDERYIPFKHDRDLMKEVPLVRLVSEKLILEDSKLIKQ